MVTCIFTLAKFWTTKRDDCDKVPKTKKVNTQIVKSKKYLKILDFNHVTDCRIFEIMKQFQIIIFPKKSCES